MSAGVRPTSAMKHDEEACRAVHNSYFECFVKHFSIIGNRDEVLGKHCCCIMRRKKDIHHLVGKFTQPLVLFLISGLESARGQTEHYVLTVTVHATLSVSGLFLFGSY